MFVSSFPPPDAKGILWSTVRFSLVPHSSHFACRCLKRTVCETFLLANRLALSHHFSMLIGISSMA